MADHTDTQAAALEYGARPKHRITPGRLLDVAGKERKPELLDELLDPLGTIGELPVRGHGVDTERVHDAYHVGATALQRGIAALPGVAAIEQQHLARALGANRPDQSGEPIEATHPTVGPGKAVEVGAGQGIGVVGAAPDPVIRQQPLTHEVRRQALGVSYADVDRRLAEIDRHELGVQVGEVEQSDLPHRREAQQISLRRTAALRGSADGRASGRHRGQALNQLTPR